MQMPASTPGTTQSRLPIWLLVLLLALMTLAFYWPAMSHDFVNYDDHFYVTENLHVQNGLSQENLKWAFIKPLGANWHPLTMLSHMLDCQMYGLKPWGHHLTSVLFHTVNTVLVFLLIRSLTGAVWRSVMVAALFGLHPVHVESVAWVAERKDVLSSCFGLLCLIFYTRYARKLSARELLQTQGKSVAALNSRPAMLDYALALLFLALGLMSKPMLVTWPFVMLLLDYWPLARTKTGKLWPLIREKLPFFALVMLSSIVTFLVQKSAGAVATVSFMPLDMRVENALISYCRYLGKIFWPGNLAVFYPYPDRWPVAGVMLAGGLLLGLSVFFGRQRQYPFLLTGWLWFIGTLVPVIGLVQVGGQAMADRYTYIPSLGIFILAVWGMSELTRGWRYQAIGLATAGLTAIILCVSLTWKQLEYWQDDEALFGHALQITKDNYVASNGFGYALLKKNQIDEAVSQFQAALRLQPNYATAHFNLGDAFGKKGQIDDQIKEFEETLRLEPDSAFNHYNLGLVLRQKGRIDDAINQYKEAIQLDPDYVDARNNLGFALLKTGQTDEAISQFQEALRLQPTYFEAHNNLGIALAKKGRLDEAIVQFQEVVRLNPEYAAGQANLDKALKIRESQTGRVAPLTP